MMKPKCSRSDGLIGNRIGTARLLQRWIAEHVVGQAEGDEVEHDGRDDLMRPGCRLQPSSDRRPQAAGNHSGKEGERKVDVEGQAG
jgi:hypothetical protein